MSGKGVRKTFTPVDVIIEQVLDHTTITDTDKALVFVGDRDRLEAIIREEFPPLEGALAWLKRLGAGHLVVYDDGSGYIGQDYVPPESVGITWNSPPSGATAIAAALRRPITERQPSEKQQQAEDIQEIALSLRGCCQSAEKAFARICETLELKES